jgi:hypothetical protein
MNAGAWPKDAERTRKWWYRSLEEQDDINLAYRWTLSLPAWSWGSPRVARPPNQSHRRSLAYRPATESDAEKLQAMAKDCGSIFKREEDTVASAHLPYPHHRTTAAKARGHNVPPLPILIRLIYSLQLLYS